MKKIIDAPKKEIDIRSISIGECDEETIYCGDECKYKKYGNTDYSKPTCKCKLFKEDLYLHEGKIERCGQCKESTCPKDGQWIYHDGSEKWEKTWIDSKKPEMVTKINKILPIDNCDCGMDKSSIITTKITKQDDGNVKIENISLQDKPENIPELSGNLIVKTFKDDKGMAFGVAAYPISKNNKDKAEQSVLKYAAEPIRVFIINNKNQVAQTSVLNATVIDEVVYNKDGFIIGTFYGNDNYLRAKELINGT